MIALLLSLALAFQGIPLQPQQGGRVSGVLKDSLGKPVAGIRIAAIAKPQSLDEAATSAAMSALAATDEQGRYALESIPPGRYFIAAGRLDAQTYYPGTSDMATAKEVAVTAGSEISGLDFTLGDSSYGRAGTGGSLGSSLALPLRVTIEGGGKLPLSAGGRVITVKLDMGGGSAITAPISSSFVNIPGPQTTAYRVTVENLPETYAVKSITYGATDLLTNTLRLTPANFPGAASTLLQFGGFAPAPGATPQQAPAAFLAPLIQRGLVSLPQDPAAQQAYLAGVAAALAGQGTTLGQAMQTAALAGVPLSGNTVVSLSAPAAPIAPSLLSITLQPVAPKTTNGVRVSGRVSLGGTRTVYVSGIPGTVYSDGTFEVYGVPPGRHAIVTRDNPGGTNPLAASVVVENGNLDGIVLAETAMLPRGAWEPSPPKPAAGHPVGNVPLARLTGSLIEELSKQPVTEGTVIVKTNGYYSASFGVDTDGHFELPPLLPGTYDLEVQIFGHSNIKESFEIDDKDMKLELITRKLY